MRIVMIALGILEIGYGAYRIYQGDTLEDQILLFIMGILLFGMSFTLDKSKKSKK